MYAAPPLYYINFSSVFSFIFQFQVISLIKFVIVMIKWTSENFFHHLSPSPLGRGGGGGQAIKAAVLFAQLMSSGLVVTIWWASVTDVTTERYRLTRQHREVESVFPLARNDLPKVHRQDKARRTKSTATKYKPLARTR